MTDCLGLFAKFWQPGAVKTRLAATLGDVESARIYQQFVLTLLDRLANIAQHQYLCFTPGEHKPDFERISPEPWQLEPQTEGDLGLRMQTFFQNKLSDGHQRVVLLGTDSPNVPIDYIRQAFQDLQTHDVVLGPTEDGGYWLIGLSTEVPKLFANIPWGTEQVFEKSIAALKATNHSYSLLPTWYDVDVLEDLARLKSDLQAASPLEPALQKLLQAIA